MIISVIVFNIIIPILSIIDGYTKNEILIKIGNELFQR